MKKLALLIAIVVIVGSGLFGSAQMSAMADEPEVIVPPIFYKSVEIMEGDTLWGIAREYAPELDMEITDYVQQLKQMNRLDGDTIHAGRYLTVMYCGGVG